MIEFDGITYNSQLDYSRLSSQLERVRELMNDGKWRSLASIARIIGGSEAGISARLRDLRKERFGSFEVERQRINGGLWVYRMKPSVPMQFKIAI